MTDYYDKDTSEASSIMEFLVGWAGIFYMPYGIPWLANPLLILSWRFSLRGRIAKAVFLSFLSSIFAGSFLLFHKMPANEAPTYANIITIELGYWLWLASCLVFSFGTSIVFLIKKAQKTA